MVGNLDNCCGFSLGAGRKRSLVFRSGQFLGGQFPSAHGLIPAFGCSVHFPRLPDHHGGGASLAHGGAPPFGHGSVMPFFGSDTSADESHTSVHGFLASGFGSVTPLHGFLKSGFGFLFSSHGLLSWFHGSAGALRESHIFGHGTLKSRHEVITPRVFTAQGPKTLKNAQNRRFWPVARCDWPRKDS